MVRMALGLGMESRVNCALFSYAQPSPPYTPLPSSHRVVIHIGSAHSLVGHRANRRRSKTNTDLACRSSPRATPSRLGLMDSCGRRQFVVRLGPRTDDQRISRPERPLCTYHVDRRIRHCRSLRYLFDLASREVEAERANRA